MGRTLSSQNAMLSGQAHFLLFWPGVPQSVSSWSVLSDAAEGEMGGVGSGKGWGWWGWLWWTSIVLIQTGQTQLNNIWNVDFNLVVTLPRQRLSKLSIAISKNPASEYQPLRRVWGTLQHYIHHFSLGFLRGVQHSVNKHTGSMLCTHTVCTYYGCYKGMEQIVTKHST